MSRFDLVFEGGGAKGVVFIGALDAFFAAGHTPARLVGTSAGAITATLLAAGFTPSQVEAAMQEQDPTTKKPRPSSFLDAPTSAELSSFVAKWDISTFTEAFRNPLIGTDRINAIARRALGDMLGRNEQARTAFTFLERGGIYSGAVFLSWMREKLTQAGLDPNCTFAQLYAARSCDLSLVATDTTAGEMLVLNHRTAPSLPVAIAVRMSMSIPFLWAEVLWDANWGAYRGRTGDNAITGHAIVDGGVLSSFPIDLVADDSPKVKAVMGADTDPHAAGTLGLLIDECLPVPGIDARPPRHSIAAIARLQRLIDTMTQAHDKVNMETYRDFICHLPAKGFGTTEFEASQSRMKAMIDAGRAAMQAHLQSQNTPRT